MAAVEKIYAYISEYKYGLKLYQDITTIFVLFKMYFLASARYWTTTLCLYAPALYRLGFQGYLL